MTAQQNPKHLARLQLELADMRAREVAEIIRRIREAIAMYGLTEAELFGTGGTGASGPTTAHGTPQKAKGRRSQRSRPSPL